MMGGISETSLSKIRGVLRCYPQVEQAIVYGSRAKGTHRNGSDIDLTLQGGDELTFDIFGKILIDLDNQFLPYSIDLSIFADITDTDLIAHIRRVGIVLYRKDAEDSARGTALEQAQ